MNKTPSASDDSTGKGQIKQHEIAAENHTIVSVFGIMLAIRGITSGKELVAVLSRHNAQELIAMLSASHQLPAPSDPSRVSSPATGVAPQNPSSAVADDVKTVLEICERCGEYTHDCLCVGKEVVADSPRQMEREGYSRAPVVQGDSIKVGCLDCYAPYPFGLDLVLPDQQWNHLVPGGVGLLCPSCISKRAGLLSGATVILAWIDHFDWTAPRPVAWFQTPKLLSPQDGNSPATSVESPETNRELRTCCADSCIEIATWKCVHDLVYCDQHKQRAGCTFEPLIASPPVSSVERDTETLEEKET